MTTPMENILTLLGPGCMKETTEDRFNTIFAQLKVLGWKSKKSARYDWVSFFLVGITLLLHVVVSPP